MIKDMNRLSWRQILHLKYMLFSDAFFAVIEVIYFTEVLHLSFSQFAYITSMTIIASMLLEIPTGIISDKYGRKKMLIAGNIIAIMGNLPMLLVPLFFTHNIFLFILLSQLVIIIGISLASGNFQVLIYEYFKKSEKDDAVFERAAGNFFAQGAVIAAIISLLSTILFDLNPYIPLVCDMLIRSIQTISFCSLPDKNYAKENMSTEKRRLGISLKDGEPIKWIIISTLVLFALIFAISRSMFSLYQPMMTASQIPLTLYDSLMLFINLGVFFIVRSKKFKLSKNNIPVISCLALILQIILLFVFFFQNMWIKFVIFVISLSIIQILRVIGEGLSSLYINQEISESKNKTFYFSLYQTIMSIILAICFWAIGYMNNIMHNYVFTYVLISFVSAILLAMVFAWRFKIKL